MNDPGKGFVLEDLVYSRKGVKFQPDAEVFLIRPDGEPVHRAATVGVGTVGRVFSAVKNAVQMDLELENYQVSSISSGPDAIAQCTAQVRLGTRVITGIGKDGDVVIASARAFVEAASMFLSGHAVIVGREIAI